MKIIACLGNPGKKYKNTRHNIGFIIGEHLAVQYNININKKIFSALYGSGKIDGIESVLLFPQTYMNQSGLSVQSTLNYYKTDYSDLLVIHDDIELSFADFRIKKGGGHKGHNGLRSIVQQTGSSNFTRMRFGVGRPENENISVADFVLSNFTGEEKTRINEMFPEITALIIKTLKGFI